MNAKHHFLLITIVLLLAALACNAGQQPPALPTQLPADLPPEPDPNATFEDEWKKALADALTSGSFTLTITEAQLTELINRKVSENPQANLSNLQVFLRDGEIQLQGISDSGAGSATLQINIRVSVSSDGKLQAEVTSAQLGPFPVPESLLTGISQTMNDSLNEQNADKVQIESIVIENGTMSLTGTLK